MKGSDMEMSGNNIQPPTNTSYPSANPAYPPINPPAYSDYPSDHRQVGCPYPPPMTVIYPANVGVVGGPTVVPGVVVSTQMGNESSHIVCRSCNQRILTRVERRPTTKTHLFAILLCVIGLWPCVCLPYCMDSCNSADHFCPNCDAYVGSYIS